jgi:hypothetical protein
MRVWLALRCAIVATALAMAGSGVQAAPIHPISYDPPTGNGTLDSHGCTVESDGCTIDLLTTLITDSFENSWQLPAPLFDISQGEGFGEGGELESIQTPFFTVNLVSGDGTGASTDSFVAAFVSQQSECSTAQFRLNIDNSTELFNQCGVDNQGTYVIGAPLAAPEPISLSLILGGATAAWLVRRRKRAG